jgi:hypothetical protein
MNNEEAIAVLDEELAKCRSEPYENLVTRITTGSLHFERTAPSGTRYQVQIQVFWDDRRGGNVRVLGSIDNGGWRAFVPVNRDFIKAPDGSFVGD